MIAEWRAHEGRSAMFWTRTRQVGVVGLVAVLGCLLIPANRPGRWGWLFLGVGLLLFALLSAFRLIRDSWVDRGTSGANSADRESTGRQVSEPPGVEIPSASSEGVAIPGETRTTVLDQDVRFTIYRPERVR